MVFNKAVVSKPFIKRAYICRKPAISHYKHKAEFSVSFAETAIKQFLFREWGRNPRRFKLVQTATENWSSNNASKWMQWIVCLNTLTTDSPLCKICSLKILEPYLLKIQGRQAEYLFRQNGEWKQLHFNIDILDEIGESLQHLEYHFSEWVSSSLRSTVTKLKERNQSITIANKRLDGSSW